MPSCFVRGCVWDKKSRLHAFPNPRQDKERLQKWLVILGFDPTTLDLKIFQRNKRICEKHFKAEDISTCINGRLKHWAEPTLFLPTSPKSLTKEINFTQKNTSDTKTNEKDELKSAEVHPDRDSTSPSKIPKSSTKEIKAIRKNASDSKNNEFKSAEVHPGRDSKLTSKKSKLLKLIQPYIASKHRIRRISVVPRKKKVVDEKPVEEDKIQSHKVSRRPDTSLPLMDDTDHMYSRRMTTENFEENNQTEIQPEMNTNLTVENSSTSNLLEDNGIEYLDEDVIQDLPISQLLSFDDLEKDVNGRILYKRKCNFMNSKYKNILIGVTGGMAVLDLPYLVNYIQSLSSQGGVINVKVVATKNALRFLNKNDWPSSVELLSDCDEWQLWKKPGDMVLHVQLAKWADLFVIAPLNANTLAKISQGICDNVLTCVARSWKYDKPFIFCPSMNEDMWCHPVTSKQIAELKSWGYFEIHCNLTASKHKQFGEMAEIETIVRVINSLIYSGRR